MTENKQFIINETDSGDRLDIFLTGKLEISRSQAQKMIENNLVTVNGEVPKKAGNTMRMGYKIVILSKAKDHLITDARDSSARSQNDKKEIVREPKIIAKTADYLVIEKPTGMLTHPTMANEKNALSSWLTKKYPSIKKVGDDPELRPGIVHRLDKEASGLLVVARTQKMFNHLKEQFKNRTVEKEYLALVHGVVQRDWEELTFPIARSETADRMAARPLSDGVTEGAKEAKTEFFVEKRFVNFTLLRVILHTGRMHQIRVHMLAYNHPLAGDPLYFQKKRKRTWDEKLGRLFLHSTKLSFIDLHGDKQTFKSPLPKELQEFLIKIP